MVFKATVYLVSQDIRGLILAPSSQPRILVKTCLSSPLLDK